MLFKPRMSAEIQDWITPPQVEVVKVATHSEQLDAFSSAPRSCGKRWGHVICATKRIACGAWTGSRTGRAAPARNVRAMKRAA